MQYDQGQKKNINLFYTCSVHTESVAEKMTPIAGKPQHQQVSDTSRKASSKFTLILEYSNASQFVIIYASLWLWAPSINLCKHNQRQRAREQENKDNLTHLKYLVWTGSEALVWRTDTSFLQKRDSQKKWWIRNHSACQNFCLQPLPLQWRPWWNSCDFEV